MALHGQPAAPGTDPLYVGPRWRTLIRTEATDPDRFPRAEVPDPDGDWRRQAWEYWEASRQAFDEWRNRAHAQSRLEALNADPEPGEAEQFARWVALAIEAGNAHAQIAFVDTIPVPPAWLWRYQQALRDAITAHEQPQSSSPDRRGYDTGTIFYDRPTAADRTREV